MRRAGRWAAALGAALCAACASPVEPLRLEGPIAVEPGFGSEEDGRAEAWLRHARARAAGAPGRGRHAPQSDPPPFEQEVYARSFMARVWAELAATRGYRDPYLAALVAVEEAGFMREYTWQCLHVLRGLRPSGLRMAEFHAWFDVALPDHEVETWTVVGRHGAAARIEVGRRAHEPYVCESEPNAGSGQRAWAASGPAQESRLARAW